MENFEDQIKEILTESKDSIKQAIKEKLLSDLQYSISYQVKSRLEEEAKKFTEAEILPEVAKMLENSKEEILAELQKGIIGVAGEIAKSMTASASKNLSTSWNVREIIQKIFN